MKIVYIPSFFSIHDYKFISKLMSSGHHIHIIDYFNEELSQEKPEIDIYHKTVALKDLTVHKYKRVKKFDNNNPVLNASRILLKTKFLKKVLKSIKADILHSGWVQSNSLYAALSGFHPLLIMPWGSDILINPHKSKIMYYLSRYILRKADMVYSDSQTINNEVKKIGGIPNEKTVVFPQLGVDIKVFSPSSVEEKHKLKKQYNLENKTILLMTRLLEPNYGIEYFLKSLPIIINKHPAAHAVLISGGSLMNKLKQLTSDLNLSQHVSFKGFIDYNEMPQYFKMSDIYVSSSLTDGSSLSLLEAMSSGLPVVVSDVPSITEWVTDGLNGNIFKRKEERQYHP